MKRIIKYLDKFLKRLVNYIFERLFFEELLFKGLLLPIAIAFLAGLWLTLNDKWEWFTISMRVLKDGFYSGYVHGTPFKTAQGHWAVDWRLGGPPFIHVILPYIFTFFLLSAVVPFFICLMRRYYSFRRLKKVCTYLKNPRNFREYISVRCVAAVLIMSIVGLAGIVATTIDPNIIVPAERSKDYFECNMHITAILSITITRYVIVEANPSILYENNMSGWFYCIIKIPENSRWSISDIDTFKILFNDKIIPYIKSVHYDNNSTEFILAKSDKSFLAFLFENEASIKLETVTLKVDGKLKNGDFFAGDTQIRIMFT